MTNRIIRKPSRGKKLLPTVLAVVAVAGPIVIATMNTPRSAQAQTAITASPTFEVASVKRSAGTGGQGAAARAIGWGDVTGRVTLEYVTLQEVLRHVFSLQPYQLSGPPWLGSELYDILAIVPRGAPKEEIPLMFQVLLEDRFKLKFHRETLVAPVYALVVGEGGPRLKEPVPDDTSEVPTEKVTGRGQNMSIFRSGTGSWGRFKLTVANGTLHNEFASITMKVLASYLNEEFFDLPVIDMTDLQGSYQATLDILLSDLPKAPDRQTINQGDADQAVPRSSDPRGNSVRESLQKLGLRLERRRAPTERFMIDHVEKVPTEN